MAGESPAAVLFDAVGNAINVLLRNTVYRLAITSEAEHERDDVYFANFIEFAISSTKFVILVDLDSADYKHTPGTKCKLVAVRGGGFKSSAGAKWAVRLATILAIDGTEATIGFSLMAAVSLRDTSSLGAITEVETIFPVYMDLEVAGGDFVRLTTNATLTTTDINTGITIKNAAGEDATPAVGDVVLEIEQVSGGGTLDYGFSCAYVVS